MLKLYQAERYISYELGALSDYHYYTGIIFSGYTFGTGEPIVKGGRYDKLLKYFGKDAPAIGFAIASDQLLAAIPETKDRNNNRQRLSAFALSETTSKRSHPKGTGIEKKRSFDRIVMYG